MKRIIKKSTTITEIIKDDKGKEYIIDRKFDVNFSTETPNDSLLLSPNEIQQSWIERDKYFREEIAKEAEEYKKKNPLPEKEK
jgi:hypothetical protein